MAQLTDGRRNRSAAGALMEMSVLANEKERLRQELLFAERRRSEIEKRLAEIAQKEHRLQKFVENPVLPERVIATAEDTVPAPSMAAKELRY